MKMLDELERLAKAATPGPWKQHKFIGIHSPYVYKAHGSMGQIARTMRLSTDADASFIAAANPATVLALVEALQAAQAMRAFCKDFSSAAGYVSDFDAALAKLEQAK